MFKLATFTDEITQDFQKAVDVAVEYGLEGLEIRSVWDTPVQDLSADQIQKMKDILSETNLTVCCIASPFYKCEMDSAEEIRQHHDILRRSIAVGRAFDCKLIRGFTFWRRGRTEDVYGRILDLFEEPVKILQAEGAMMGIENESSTYIGTGVQTGKFLGDLACPHVQGVWDPCNSAADPDYTEVSFPFGYLGIQNYMIHVHLKDWGYDFDTGKGRCVPIGSGVIDFKGQFRALLDDNFDGYLSLETHWRPVALDEKIVNRPGGSEFSRDAEFASRCCLENIKHLIATAREMAPGSWKKF